VLRQANFASEGEKELENHISVEMSSDYEGFAPDYYITVGYIAESAEEAEKKAAEFKKLAPGTYVKKTKLFMGCDR
jgi:predicted phage-related endonuclease